MMFKQRKVAMVLFVTLLTSSFNNMYVYGTTDDISEIEAISDIEYDVDLCDSDKDDFDLKTNVVPAKNNTKTDIKPYNANISLDNYTVDRAVNNEQIVLKAYENKQFLSNVGTMRGDHQIRGIIPYILKAGETVTVRQTDGLEQLDFYLELKSGYRDIDVSATISKDGSYVSATAVKDSVIYIRMLRTAFSDVTFEYSISKATTLPIYTHNQTDVNTFFAEWDTLGSKYAILETDVAVLQIPDINKEYLRKIATYGEFDSIDHLLTYYQEMIKFFDYSYGLDGSTEYNYNPKQRYLAIPELVNSTTAGTYTTHAVRAYGATNGMLRMLEDSWLAKHEFAHGYQGDMMDADVRVREIWNNIPTHYYSMDSYSNNKSYAKKYNEISKYINQKAVYDNSVSIRNNGSNPAYDLNFFREIFDQYGLEVFVKFNQEYRCLGITKQHNTITNSNQFAKLFSRYAGVDLIPYFLSFNANIDDLIIEENIQLPKTYYLTDLVKNKELKNYVISQYDLATEYSIVDTSIFAKDSNLSSLTGDLSVNINIDNSEELIGKQVLLKNGDIEIKSEIQDSVAKFDKIPVGVYNLLMPISNSGNYYDNAEKYVIVTENSDETIDVTYVENKYFHLNMLYNFTIRNNSNFTPLTATVVKNNVNDYVLNITTLGGRQNASVGDNELYASFKVIDDEGNVVYDNSFYNATPSIDSNTKIPISEGYIIHMFRSKANGHINKKFFGNLVSGIDYRDSSTESMIFEVTKDGIVYTNDINMVDTKDLIDKYISNSSNSYFKELNQYIYRVKREDLKNGIMHLNDTLASEYSKNNVLNTRVNNPEIKAEEQNIEISIGESYNLKDYVSASDIEDGDLTEKIEILITDFDVNSVGEYYATYRVEDSDYNYATAEIKFKVVESPETDVNVETEDNDVNTETEDSNNNITTETEDTNNGNAGNDVEAEDTDDNNTIETETDNNSIDTETDNTNISNDVEKDVINNSGANSSSNYEDDDDRTSPSKPLDLGTNTDSNEQDKVINKYSANDYLNNKVLLNNRKPYSVYTYQINSKDTPNVVPFYYNDKGIKKYLKYSYVNEDSKLLFMNNEGYEIYFENNSKSFDDVTDNWAKSSINFVSEREIINGTSPNKFDPKGSVTRAMLVTILGRISGEEVVGYKNTFNDVKNGVWYTDYISWAKAKNIVNGISEDTFGPTNDITREQLAVILSNFLRNTLKYEIIANEQVKFGDDDKISPWAKESIYMLKSIGLVSGDSLNNFNPKSSLTREELSAIITRFMKYVVNIENTLSLNN